MDEHFLQNKPYIEFFWDTLPHNVVCQISASQKNRCFVAGIFYCGEDCVIILTVGEQYITEQHMSCNWIMNEDLWIK